MFLSNNFSSGDIKLSNLSCFISLVVDNLHVESLRGHRIINNTSVSNTVKSSHGQS